MKPRLTEVEIIEARVRRLTKTNKWRQALRKSNSEVEITLKKLREDSKVDPKLLDEPAVI